jgi:hypothetical protein
MPSSDDRHDDGEMTKKGHLSTVSTETDHLSAMGSVRSTRRLHHEHQ